MNNTRRRGRKYYQVSSRVRNEPKADILNKKFEKSDKILVIACGALAKEITALIQMNNWTHLQLRYLPAKLHNEPKNIPQNIRKYLVNAQNKFSRIFIGYADCGTGGKLDNLLEEFGVQRLPGAHCYEFFSSTQTFSKMLEEEPGSFFLTDFLVKSFEKLIWQGLKINSHPELLNIYFRHYKRLVYLAQTESQALQTQAKEIAQRLELNYFYRFTGYGALSPSLSDLTTTD
ncbi:MAG: DUF1638 domain-containing protein [SAR324 cluster bacterium]|nr:DUF1638 domain-containing protein [SAR324 cluster bacterium]